MFAVIHYFDVGKVITDYQIMTSPEVKRSRTNQWSKNLPISSYEDFINTTVYEHSLSYFFVQLAVVKKKHTLTALKKAYVPKLCVLLDFGLIH